MTLSINEMVVEDGAVTDFAALGYDEARGAEVDDDFIAMQCDALLKLNPQLRLDVYRILREARFRELVYRRRHEVAPAASSSGRSMFP